MSGSPDVLVGFTGLVGGNLLLQRPFDVRVNSKNAEVLEGGRFGHVVFSAARAEKWRANADPDADARHIDELIRLASGFSAERVTLISTVDVFAEPRDVDETSSVLSEGLHPYGAGRRRLEEAMVRLHSEVLVARLPGLFGPGLKKNVVHDLLHEHEVDRIQPASAFQFYDLAVLGDHLDAARAADLRLAHLVTEPITTADIVARVFGRDPLPPVASNPVRYDVRTVHAEVFGGIDGYVQSADQVVDRMRAFVRAEGGQ